MKIISTVVYFLIAGILSTTIIAQDLTESAEEASDSGRADDFAYANSLLRSIPPEQLKTFKTECEKNGGPKAYNNYKQSVENWSTCFAHVKATSEFEAYGVSPQSDGGRYLKKFCSHVSEIEDCFKTSKEPSAACLGPKERDTLNIFYKVMNSVLDFVCADNARRITEFFENGGPKCLLSELEAASNCQKQTDNLTQKLHILQSPFEHEQCTAFGNLQHCWVGVFKNCENQKPSDVVDSLFNVVIQETPCKYFLKSSSARINLLSTTVLMGIVMFVRFA